MSRVLITGANRGIGLELTKQLLEAGEFVFAGCRNPERAIELQNLVAEYEGQAVIVQLDVTSDDSVMAAKTAVSAQTNQIDLLINNAGVLVPNETIDNFDLVQMERTYQVNVFGAMRVVTQFADLLRAGSNAKLVNVSSQLGSLLAMKSNWGEYSYNSSKAALNMLTRMLSFELKRDNVTVISMHPGWVQTDMGGQNARLTPPASASGIIEVIRQLTLEDTNKFYTFAGDEHLW